MSWPEAFALVAVVLAPVLVIVAIGWADRQNRK